MQEGLKLRTMPSKGIRKLDKSVPLQRPIDTLVLSTPSTNLHLGKSNCANDKGANMGSTWGLSSLFSLPQSTATEGGQQRPTEANGGTELENPDLLKPEGEVRFVEGTAHRPLLCPLCLETRQKVAPTSVFQH
jgi:hypothetical protein